MVTYTTTYNLKKPTVGQDDDLWGGYANDTYDLIDDLLDGTTPVTGIDINSGTLDNVVIGGATANSGTFTVLSATTSLGVTGNITVSGTVDGVDIATRDGVLTTTTTTANAALPKAGGTMTGAITFATGQTFDGRDVSADGAKLDGIESGATADQTASEILTLIKTVDGAGSGLDADTLDGVSSGSFLRSDAADTATGDITFSGAAQFSGTIGNSTTSLDSVRIGRSSGGDPQIQLTGNGVNAHIDFSNTSGEDYDVRLINNATNQLDIQGTSTTGLKSNGNTVWHAGNDGSGSGLDADLWDGNQFSSYLNQAVLTSSSPTFSNLYVGDNVYHSGDTDTRMLFGTNTITLQTGGSSEITVNTTGVRLGDSGNGYFQPVSGNYGSIQIDGGAHSGWEGYSIGGRAVFMHDNNAGTGIYNDVNNEWLFYGVHNGKTSLYYNGSEKLDTLSNGVSINGNLYTDGSNAEDYDALSGTTPTCNVDNAGAFSLTMTGNTTFTFSGADNNWSQGFVLQLTGNGSTVTWPTSVDWAGGTAPDAPASGETDIYVFWTRDGGTTWYGVQSIDAAA